MTSTKITEHDLDPTMDMAKETTSQEILKKVEDAEKGKGGKHLNVIPYYNEAASKSAGETATILDVTGSGKFCFAAVATDTLGVGRITEFAVRVTIDGVVKSWMKYSVSSVTVSSPVIGIFPMKWLIPCGENMHFISNLNLKSNVRIFFPVEDWFVYELSEEVVDLNINGGSCISAVILDDDIRFNESVKVEIIRSANNYGTANVIKGLCGYILD